jgi:group I intron endonuclease
MMRDKQSGVYIITNTVNGNRYIGSTVHVRVRLIEHIRNLRENRHRNKHLQYAWNKYGEECFVFEPLLYCDRSMTLFYEQLCLDNLHPEYNFAKDAKAPMLGIKLSDEHRLHISMGLAGKKNALGTKRDAETRARMSLTQMGNTKGRGNKSRTGQHPSEETRIRLSAALMGNTRTLGYKHTAETRRKMSEARKGRTVWNVGIPCSDEAKAKIKATTMGHSVSEVTRHRLSVSNLGHSVSEDTKRKIGDANRGRIRSEETKKKMSEAQYKRHYGTQPG